MNGTREHNENARYEDTIDNREVPKPGKPWGDGAGRAGAGAALAAVPGGMPHGGTDYAAGGGSAGYYGEEIEYAVSGGNPMELKYTAYSHGVAVDEGDAVDDGYDYGSAANNGGYAYDAAVRLARRSEDGQRKVSAKGGKKRRKRPQNAGRREYGEEHSRGEERSRSEEQSRSTERTAANDRGERPRKPKRNAERTGAESTAANDRGERPRKPRRNAERTGNQGERPRKPKRSAEYAGAGSNAIHGSVIYGTDERNTDTNGRMERPRKPKLKRSAERPRKLKRSVMLEDLGTIERRQRRRKNRYSLKPLVICMVLLGIFLAAWQLYLDGMVYNKKCRVEAGVAVSPADFMQNADAQAEFVGGSPDVTVPGKYKVRVKSGFFINNCILTVEDTIAPKAQAVKVIVEAGESCEAGAFVQNMEDATEVTVSYVKQPDFTKLGSQAVSVLLIDKGGNRTTVEAELVVSKVAASVTVEAGGKPPALEAFASFAGYRKGAELSEKEKQEAAADFAKRASFVTSVQEIDYAKVGEHEVSLKVDGETYTSILRIVDTVPPKAQMKDVDSFAFLVLDAQAFVEKVEDVTEVTASYKQEPDWGKIGSQTVEIVLTDGGNNETIKSASLTLQKDTEKPVIVGAKDLKVFVGDSVAYRKNVKVQDNCPEPELTVDSSKVDMNTPGTYEVTYTAKDVGGNTASVTVKVTVAVREYSIEKVNELADKVLAEIIKPNMTDREKLKAIYNYNLTHIGYINDSEKEDYVKAAYQGLKNQQGDCFVYASAAKVLLTRAGIKNMDIEKIPAQTLHYWNLVDIGDGWYHFDTTPRKDRPTIFMWTDKQLMEYSESHNKSHNYDHDLYPEVN